MIVDKAPIASVIIPSRNVAHILSRQLAALAHQTLRNEFEVIVADNGSTDGTAESALSARERPAQLRVVSAAERQGITHARNVGARNAQSALLLFCDADDVVDETWVEEMVAALGRADIVGGRLEYEKLNPLHVRAWRPAIADRQLPIALGHLPFAVGANFGIRRRAWDEIGGCDEQFIACFDDVDLSWRVQLADGTIEFAPQAVIHYQLRTRLRELARQQFTYGLTEARFFKKFQAVGLQRPAIWPAARLWGTLAVRWFYILRSTELRGNWIREVAYRAGRAVGGARMRTTYW